MQPDEKRDQRSLHDADHKKTPVPMPDVQDYESIRGDLLALSADRNRRGSIPPSVRETVPIHGKKVARHRLDSL